MQRCSHNANQRKREVKYIQIQNRQDVYAVFYRESNILCLNRCFAGKVKLIIFRSEK